MLDRIRQIQSRDVSSYPVAQRIYFILGTGQRKVSGMLALVPLTISVTGCRILGRAIPEITSQATPLERAGV
jgi:hypothetical protein